MLNLNASNDYSMNFSHHLTTASDQQFYNLYSNVPPPPPVTSFKEKNEFLYKSQKFDFINNNASEVFVNSPKDCENSKRFSVNNLLKSPSDTVEKLGGKQIARASEVIKKISGNFIAFKKQFVFIKKNSTTTTFCGLKEIFVQKCFRCNYESLSFCFIIHIINNFAHLKFQTRLSFVT
jgi:hypothetical protein